MPNIQVLRYIEVNKHLWSLETINSLRRADHSSRGVLPTVVRRCVWSRNIKNEKAMTRVGSQRKKKKNCYLHSFFSEKLNFSGMLVKIKFEFSRHQNSRTPPPEIRPRNQRGRGVRSINPRLRRTAPWVPKYESDTKYYFTRHFVTYNETSVTEYVSKRYNTLYKLSDTKRCIN
jgi:hypothetical protein